MSELSDLEEFNKRVGSGDDRDADCQPIRGQTVRGKMEEVENALKDLLYAHSNLKKWAVYGGKRFRPCEDAVPQLEAGVYSVEASNELGIYFERKQINIDDLVILPDTVSEKIIGDIELFWTKEEHYREFGFLWKRGFMFWGPAGSGKTSTIQLIMKKIIERDGLAILASNPELTGRGLTMLREVERTRPLVVILEDIDAIIESHGESELLALLDGEIQIDNVVFIATTNYPERLDRRFINRPSRFDVVQKIGMPNPEARRAFIALKNPKLNKSQLERWVKETKDFSVAHIKELIISVQVLGIPFEQAALRLRKMSDVPRSGDFDRKVGFNMNDDDGE